MEYLQIKQSKYVRAVSVDEKAQSITIYLNNLNGAEPHVSCVFYILDKEGKPRESQHPAETREGSLIKFYPNPRYQPGTLVFFTIHGQFLVPSPTKPGEMLPASDFSTHHQFRVPGFSLNTGKDWFKPKHLAPPPPQEVPLVFPTGDMEKTPEFEAIQAKVMEEYQTKYPELNKVQLSNKYATEILQHTTRRYRYQYPEESAKHDLEERTRIRNPENKDDPNKDPVIRSYEVELNRRLALAEKNLEYIKDPKEKARRLEEIKQHVTRHLADHFVTNWREKAEAYHEASNVLNIPTTEGGRTMQEAMDALKKREAEALAYANRRRWWQPRSRETTQTTEETQKDIVDLEEERHQEAERMRSPLRMAIDKRLEAQQRGSLSEEEFSRGLTPEEILQGSSDDSPDFPGISSGPEGTNETPPTQTGGGTGYNSGEDGDQLPNQNSPRQNSAFSARSGSQLARARARRAVKTTAKGAQTAEKGARETLSLLRFFGGSVWPALIGAGVLGSIVFALVLGGEDLTGQNGNAGANNGSSDNLTITKTGPDSVGNDKVIPFTITANNDSGSDMQIVDNIPPNTVYESASNQPTFQDSNGKTIDASDKSKIATVIWNIAAGDAASGVTINLKPTKKDTWVLNEASVEEVTNPTSGGGTSNNGSFDGKNIPPSDNDCGKWGPGQGASYPISINPYHKNFGDPVCDYTHNDLRAMLNQYDPDNADYWFNTVLPCESGLEPNAYLPDSTSGLGAFGLFQMNPNGKGNGQYDAGDVYWKLQVTNAINYKDKVIGGAFTYWQCANSNPKNVE